MNECYSYGKRGLQPTTYFYISYLHNDATDYATDDLPNISNSCAIIISLGPTIYLSKYLYVRPLSFTVPSIPFWKKLFHIIVSKYMLITY